MPIISTRSRKPALPKTDQTTVYQTNDDGTYQKGSPITPRFVDNGDGTISDRVTNLMWVKQPELIIPGAPGVNATNQIPALDSHGDVVGKGDWVTGTNYYVSDLVKAQQRDAGVSASHALKVVTATSGTPFTSADIGREIFIGGVSQGNVTNYVSTTVVWVTSSGTTASAALTVKAYYYCIANHTSGTFLTDLAVPDWRESPYWVTSTAYLAGDLVLATQRSTGVNASQATGTTTVTAASGTPFNTDGTDVGRMVFIGNTFCGYITVVTSSTVVTVSLNQLAVAPAPLTIYSTYVSTTAHTSGTFADDLAAGKWRETLWIWLMATTGIPTNNLITPSKMRWDNGAIINCQALATNGYAGYNDWRLPNLKELVSIANYGVATAPVINTTTFPNTQSNYYWTSTTYASIPTVAWYVYFSDGSTNGNLKTGAYYVRCVRGQ